MSDDPFIELVDVVARHLEQAGIAYAVTGSVASGIFGEPVHSYDVDFVVRMNASQARQLAVTLPTRFYRSEEALEAAAQENKIANLVDMDSGLKVDLSCMKPSRFCDSIFSRRARVRFAPDAPEFFAVSAEDSILMKLDWRRDSQSSKQWRDALSVAKTQAASLDWKYMFVQAKEMGLQAELTKLRDEAGI